MKRNSVKNEAERNGTKQARLDSSKHEVVPEDDDTVVSDSAANHAARRDSDSERNVGARYTNTSSEGSVGEGIIHIHQTSTQSAESKPPNYTALKTRLKPATGDKPSIIIPFLALRHPNLMQASILQKPPVSDSSKFLTKSRLIPQTSDTSISDSKSPARPKPFIASQSTIETHQISTAVTVTSSSAVTAASSSSVTVLNHAQTLFSVSSLKDSASDLIQGPVVPQFPLYDSLYVGSPVPSPLFTDAATSFPFTSTDYIIDPESIYLEHLFSRSPSAQDNAGFTNIRSESHCARTDILQPSPLSSVVDPVRIRSPHVNTGTSAVSQIDFITNEVDSKNKSHVTALERLSAVVNNNAAKSSVSASATSSRIPNTSLVPGSMGKILHGNGTNTAIKPNRALSSDVRPNSGGSTKDLKPPPHGGMKRAGPYLLGKII